MKQYERMGNICSSLDEYRIEFDELEGAERDIFPQNKQARSNGGPSDFVVSSLENLSTATASCSSVVSRQTKRRVTIHMQPRHGIEEVKSQYGKLIFLPDSIEELRKMASMC